MKKTKLIICILLFLSINTLKAQFLGGEIRWELMLGIQYTYAQQGNFKFYLKVYQDCYTSTGPSTPYDSVQYLWSTKPGLDTIKLFLAPGYPKDVSPVCNSNQSNQIVCGGTNYQVNSGARKEYVFTTTHFLPQGVQLSGVPPTIGWTFYWNGGMRNPSNNLLGSHSVRLKSIMYPYLNQNTYPGFDNSPTTNQFSPEVICSGYSNTYNLFANDKEYDSLDYSFFTISDSLNGIIYSYNSGFSYINPLPGPSQNPANIQATINSSNGDLGFKSLNPGTYAVCIRIRAFRHITLISEIYKEIYFTLLNCTGNNLPQDVYSSDAIQYVIAGQHYTKLLKFIDLDTFSNGTHQTIRMEGYGKQLSIYPSSGCVTPPCATLLPTIPITGVDSIETVLDWQTSCSHLSMLNTCNHFSDYFDFTFIASDDFCPAPSSIIKHLTIRLISSPLCVLVNDDGTILLDFRDFKFDGNNHTYSIFRKLRHDSVFVKIDSIQSSNLKVDYHDVNALGNQNSYMYKIDRQGWDIQLEAGSQLMKITSTLVNNNTNYSISFDSNYIDYCDKSTMIFKKVGNNPWTFFSIYRNDNVTDLLTDTNQVVKYAFYKEVVLGPDTINSANTCYSISSVASFVPQGLGIDDTKIHNCQLFPNPAQNSFFLKYQSNKTQFCKISLYDANGKFLERKECQFFAGENQIKMDLNFRYNGLLMIEIVAEDDVVWKKLLKE